MTEAVVLLLLDPGPLALAPGPWRFVGGRARPLDATGCGLGDPA